MSIGILLVEDDRSQAWRIREMIRRHGPDALEVDWAPSLGEAVSRLAAERFDVVLLDLNLPDSFGLETFRRLAQACPAAPVVVLTSTDDESLAIEAVREGAQDYLVKGEAPAGVLVRSVRYAIERHRREQAEQQLLEVQEKERQRVACELHDGVIQSLVTMRLQLQMLAERLEEQDPQSALAARSIVGEAASATEEVRRITRDLHPQILDCRRLHEAICWYGRKLQAETDARLEFETKPHDALDPAVKQHLFRIFQETMRNALQHGQATVVRVRLQADADEIALTVEDDGRGFDVDATTSVGAGLGLTSVRERAQLLKGSLHIESRPGFGTLVAVRAPLQQIAVAQEIA
ncbi:MAG: response regulator [Planctomycetes bacterium]|nr:response regulator [Planctomycetota bacterium]